MIEAEQLCKTYPGGQAAVLDLNLRIEPGEVYCLLGANGAGKTTTLNLLLGFLAPTSGVARVLDQAPGPLARREMAYIPEQVALYRHLTGLENLQYFTRLAGQSEPVEGLLDLLAESGLPREQARRRCSTYSKGMRQKVAIALARARRARVVLLDEPTSGLDPLAAYEFSQLVRDLAARRVAVLMATHDLFRVKELQARVGIMKAGRLLQELTTECISASDLERVYLECMA